MGYLKTKEDIVENILQLKNLNKKSGQGCGPRVRRTALYIHVYTLFSQAVNFDI
jgi:hypothetical protein